MKKIAIVYVVAGVSSRFGGKIKQFVKVTETETLIEYSLKQAIKAGFSKIIFIVGNKTEQLFKEKFGDSFQDIPIHYALQNYNEEKRDKPWGTADALCSAKEFIDCPFVVCNGDDIYGEEPFKILYNHLQETDENATLGYQLINVIPETGITKRGIFKVEDGYVQELKETFNIEKSNLEATNSKPDDLCSMNIFAFQPEVVQHLSDILKKFKQENQEDRNAEFLLPTEISNLIKQNKIKLKIYSTSEKWVGVTNPGDEEVVREFLKNQE